MRVVDTSAWIEWFLDSPTGERIRQHIPPKEEFVVPTIVQFELAKWLRRESSDASVDAMLALTQSYVVVEFDTVLAVHAAEIAREHKLSAADAIIYASAQNCEADLLTCDAHFKDLPGVIYFPKDA